MDKSDNIASGRRVIAVLAIALVACAGGFSSPEREHRRLCDPHSSTRDWLIKELTMRDDDEVVAWMETALEVDEWVVVCAETPGEDLRGELVWFEVERLVWQDGELMTRSRVGALAERPCCDPGIEDVRVSVPIPRQSALQSVVTYEVDFGVR